MNTVTVQLGAGRRFAFHGDAHDAGASLLITTPFAGRSFAFAVDVARPSIRTREIEDGHRFPLDRRWHHDWAMNAPTAGNGVSTDPFNRAQAFVEYACTDFAEFAPAAALARVRFEAGRVIRALARHALLRCEPGALALARRLHPEARFFAYAKMIRDESGRIRQLVDSCPGLLLFCAGAGYRRGEIVDEVLSRVVSGDPMAHVVRFAVESVIAFRESWDFELEEAIQVAGRERFVRQACLLIRRAGPAVGPCRVIAAAPLVFAPEDIPRNPARNAQWYGVMAGAARGVIGHRADVARATSTFTSRHFRVIAGAATRLRLTDANEPWGGGTAGPERIVSKLAVYAAETGKRPRRCSTPTRYVAKARAWHLRERHGGSPVYRVGKLIDRLRTLELGPVAGVRFLCDDVDWAEPDGRLPFPRWPWPDVTVDGVTVSHLASAADLAEEAREMEHCAATGLADAMAGELVFFSVRMMGSRLTLALEPRHDGTYRIEELRGQGDRAPSGKERALVETWVGAVNERARAMDIRA